jgi:hypothetical protein
MWYLPELFALDGVYATYTVMLVVSGLLSIVVAAVTSSLTAGKRLLAIALGLVMLGYGVYLYLFLPEEYWIAWYVFVLPLLVVIQAFQAVRAARSSAPEADAGGVPAAGDAAAARSDAAAPAATTTAAPVDPEPTDNQPKIAPPLH